jgi:hypothetical protein
MKAYTAIVEENGREAAEAWLDGIRDTESGVETRPAGLVSVPGFDRTKEEASRLAMEKSAASPTLSAYMVGYTENGSEKAIELGDKIFEAEKDAREYEENLNIGFMRNGWKSVTCPKCKSSISLEFGGHFKVCPVCGSDEMIAPKYTGILEGKKRKVLALKEKLKNLPVGDDSVRRHIVAWSCNGN